MYIFYIFIYEGLSKSTQTDAMKSILIKLCLQILWVYKTTSVLSVVKIKARYVDNLSSYHMIWSPGEVSVEFCYVPQSH